MTILRPLAWVRFKNAWAVFMGRKYAVGLTTRVYDPTKQAVIETGFNGHLTAYAHKPCNISVSTSEDNYPTAVRLLTGDTLRITSDGDMEIVMKAILS